MEVKVVSGKEYYKMLEDEFERVMKTPGLERILALIGVNMEYFQKLKNFNKLPYYHSYIKYVTNVMYRAYVLTKRNPKSIEEIKKEAHKRGEFDYEWRKFAENINSLTGKDLLTVYSIATLYRILDTIDSVLGFNESLYDKNNPELYVKNIAYKNSKGELIIPDFIFHRNTFTNLQELIEHIRKEFKFSQDEVIEDLIKQIASKKIYTFDGIPSYADLSYFKGINFKDLEQVISDKGLFVPVSLIKFKDEKELLNFLIKNGISPYVHYKTYSQNFRETISLLNKKNPQFFKNLVVKFFTEIIPDIFTEFSYEELKELDIPDIAISVAGEESERLKGTRSYVLASLKTGKTHILVTDPRAFDEALVFDNLDKIQLGTVEQPQWFIDSIKTTEGKIAFLYKYANSYNINLQFIVTSFVKLVEPSLKLDRKYRILLLNSVEKVTDRITKYNKRVDLLLKLIDSIKPIKEYEVSRDFVEKIFSRLPNSKKIRFLSAFEPKVLSNLIQSNLLSEGEKVIITKVLNRNNVGKKGKITL